MSIWFKGMAGVIVLHPSYCSHRVCAHFCMQAKHPCCNESALTPLQLQVLCKQAQSSKELLQCNEQFREEMRYIDLEGDDEGPRRYLASCTRVDKVFFLHLGIFCRPLYRNWEWPGRSTAYQTHTKSTGQCNWPWNIWEDYLSLILFQWDIQSNVCCCWFQPWKHGADGGIPSWRCHS